MDEETLPTAYQNVFSALSDVYDSAERHQMIAELIMETLARHKRRVRETDPTECPCCGREAHYCG